MGVTPIKFGTDGWRAVIAEEYTFENVRACAQGVAAYLKANGLADRGLVVGYDTRFASEDFAQAAAETAAAHGVDVALCDRALPHARRQLQRAGAEGRRRHRHHREP